MLSKNISKINWVNISKNPGLFELDYIAMSQQRTKIIKSELIEKALHPDRISGWLDYNSLNSTW